MTDALQCLGVDSLVGQPVKRNMMLFHILPHRPKRNWHPITPFLKNLRKVPEVFTVLDSLPEKVERQKNPISMLRLWHSSWMTRSFRKDIRHSRHYGSTVSRRLVFFLRLGKVDLPLSPQRNLGQSHTFSFLNCCHPRENRRCS